MARLLDRNQAVGIGDQVLVTIGAGDVFKLGEALVEDEEQRKGQVSADRQRCKATSPWPG